VSYKYEIENFSVIEFIVMDVWREEITKHRKWSIDILTSHADHVVKNHDNRDSIKRCRKWLFENHLELFL
jgi:hypothetical protein